MNWKLFWSKVQIGNVTECWPWLKSQIPAGYGTIRINKKTYYAHRLSLQYSGVDVDGKIVRHSCDNPGCCNPMHLTAGSQKENIADAVRRGRHNPCRGEASGRAKLTESDVRRIRASTRPRVELAKKFGVSKSTIDFVIQRRSWAHVR